MWIAVEFEEFDQLWQNLSDGFLERGRIQSFFPRDGPGQFRRFRQDAF